MSSETQRRIIDAILAARDNIALIREWSGGLDLDVLRTDRKSRYAIERAFMALDAAIRDIPTDLLGVHGVPANLIAGFRNVLTHTYDDILDEHVILTIREDLPQLDATLAEMLAAFHRS